MRREQKMRWWRLSDQARLSAAYYLAERGYGVTVSEALPVAGGMLRIGIPEKRLPRWIVETEIRSLKRFGVEIKLNQPLGPGGLRLEELKGRGYGAVFLATGVQRKGKKKTCQRASSMPEIPHLAGVKETEFGLDKKGVIEADRTNLRTRVEGVFAGGDLVLGPASVIHALFPGRRAAQSIDRFLSGLPSPREEYSVTTIAYSEIDVSRFKKRSLLAPSSTEPTGEELPEIESHELAELWEAERCFKCGMFPRMR